MNAGGNHCPEPLADQEVGRKLVAIARAAIEQALGLPQATPDQSDSALQTFGACFVTPTPPEFMAHLKQKAGLSPDFWDQGLRLYRYTVSHWKESEVL